MQLVFEDDRGLGLVGPTIFSVGTSTNYIVLKQHPQKNGNVFFEFDRNTTNYFIVEKRKGTRENRKDGIQGPLTEAAYSHLASTLSLPAFSDTFPDLE